MNLLVVLLISIYSLFPLIQNFSSGLVDQEDGVLIVWILNQTISKIPDNLVNIFESNIFYPNRLTMAYTSLTIPSALVAWVAKIFSNSPIAILNFSLIFSQVVTLLILYLFLLDVSKNKISSLIATIAFGLSSIRLQYLVHLQVFSLEWFLLASWMIYKFFNTQKKIFIYLFFLFASIQVWQNLIQIYWLVFTVYFLGLEKLPLIFKNRKHFLIGGLVSLFLISPVIYAYLNVAQVNHFERSIRDAAHFSLGLDDLFTNYSSPGLFLIFLYSLFNIKKTRFLLLTIFAFLMALGPVLKMFGETFKIFNLPIPLPYAFFYLFLPGLSALRTPSRWILFSVIFMSFAIAQNLNYLNLKNHKKQILALVLIAFFGGTRLRSAINYETQCPQIYNQVEDQEGLVLAELPFYSWADENGIKIETKRMYCSLFHKKRLINGYSGFYPANWISLKKAQQTNPELLPQMFSFYKTDLIIVDSKNTYLKNIFIKSDNYELIYEDSKYLLFESI